MPSRCLACCLIALVAAGGYAATEPLQDVPQTAQKKDEPEPSLADRISAIKKEHQDRKKKFYDDLSAARNDDKQVSDLNQEYSDGTRKLADRLRALIKQRASEPEAFEGFLVYSGVIDYPLDEEMVRLLRQHHFDHPKMGQFCFHLMYRTDELTRQLLQDVAAKHPQQVVRGQATYVFGMYYRYRAQPWEKKPSEEEEAKLLREAERHFQEVAKTYAEVKTPDGLAKLGDKAASQLTRIKNLSSLKVGKVAPEIEGEDLDGKKFKLSDYRGKVVLLDFWGHW
jgi:hypothetical protein